MTAGLFPSPHRFTRAIRDTVMRILAVALAISLSACTWLIPDSVSSAANTEKTRAEMIGTWVLVSTADAGTSPSAIGNRIKVFTETGWSITETDPLTGAVRFHHGGTYTLSGTSYTETVAYANTSTAYLVGQTFRFTIAVAGDTYSQAAVSGSRWTEVWARR